MKLREVIIGVDESGTGALAGPYTVCAVASRIEDQELLRKLGARDSKKVTDLRRRVSVEDLGAKILFAWCEVVTVPVINRKRRTAWRDAVLASTRKVLALCVEDGIASDRIELIIDGSPDHSVRDRLSRELGLAARFLTKSEDQIASCGAASLIAKTSRNDLMLELHKKYPVYRWDENYGYGTADHIQAIREHGKCPEHRDFKVKALDQ